MPTVDLIGFSGVIVGVDGFVLYASQTWTQTTTYLQLVGILLGQVFFGVMGDAVGRKAAMLTDMVRLQAVRWLCGWIQPSATMRSL